ncbi:MAG: DUF1552 domain-containing protein, partial [Planctomycetales bacterium]
FGMHQDSFHPEAAGRNYELSKTLQPLQQVRDHFTVFSRLDHGVRGGHTSAHTFLSGIKYVDRARHRDGNITLDQRAAELIGGETRFPSLTLWNNKSIVSWTRAGVKVPAVAKPSDAFRLMFVEDAPSSRQGVRRSLAASGSILDAVQENANQFRKKLGVSDRRKLEEYFESIRNVEKKLEASGAWLDRPKPNVDDASAAIIAGGKRDQGAMAELFEVWLDLIILALRTDSTRVAAIDVPNGSWGLDGVTQGYHTLSHHGQREDMLLQLAVIERYQMQRLAGLLVRLADAKEADGSSLLDSTMVLFGSGMGSGSRHTNDNLPIILAGGGFRHGQHLDVAHRQPLCNLYLSMLQQLGCEVDRFNTSTGTLTGLV